MNQPEPLIRARGALCGLRLVVVRGREHPLQLRQLPPERGDHLRLQACALALGHG